ncbi:hypothetical protein MTO96_044944 [Rhipicephalus appendiculatus]
MKAEQNLSQMLLLLHLQMIYPWQRSLPRNKRKQWTISCSPPPVQWNLYTKKLLTLHTDAPVNIQVGMADIEIPLQRPKDMEPQLLTYSWYKGDALNSFLH